MMGEHTLQDRVTEGKHIPETILLWMLLISYKDPI